MDGYGKTSHALSLYWEEVSFGIIRGSCSLRDVPYNFVDMRFDLVRRYTAVFPQDGERLLDVLSVLREFLFKMPCFGVCSTSPLEILGGEGRHGVYWPHGVSDKIDERKSNSRQVYFRRASANCEYAGFGLIDDGDRWLRSYISQL